MLPPSYFAVIKLYSRLSDLKLGAVITTGFKSLPSVLLPMLYISTASLRCIASIASPDIKIDNLGFVQSCRNPSQPTFMVSAFLFTSWALTYVVEPLLPGERTLTWSNVMKLEMKRAEALIFSLLSTLSVGTLVIYALTNEEGEEISESLAQLCGIMTANSICLAFVVAYQYIISPFIYKAFNRSQTSSEEEAATSPNPDAVSFANTSTTINAL
ncbi:hypothetical protein TrST_g10302 [Triparma strigata]|uniref:Uncharacterized protein n=1 Tax=Triparma strigata TaxID=1606541 RepID=A0A9W7BD39_9STRA|nr:hypothetical protein TrST_g10302 [Triparma strigata]